MQTYDEMVDSGVDWIGDIPKGWSTARIGSLFKQRNEKVSDKDFEALSVTKKGVVPQLDDAAKTNDGDNRKLVRKGDYVINSRSDRKGSSGLSALDGSVSLINTVLAEGKLESRYTHHLLRSLPFQEEFYRCGQGIVADLWSTNYQRMKNIHLPVPGSVEQQKVADFLDQETAKIDNLIAKQERLLELLEEKRRATITHAVTRGLNPHAELKETNIPWLGQIPANWGLVRLGALYRRKSEKNFPDEELLSVYRDHGVIPKKSRDDNHNVESEDLSKYQLVLPNDLVTNKMKTWQGSIAISDIQGIVSPAYFIFQPYNNDMLPEYIHFLLRSDRYIAQYKSISKGIRPGQWDLDIDQFKIMRITVPPIGEQQKVVEAIKLNEKKTKVLKQKIQTQIKLLKERRTSLISHVVTGKVRV